MNTYFKAVILSIIVLSAGIFTAGCGNSNAETPKKETPDANQAINVKTMEIIPETFNEVIHITGSIASYEDVMVPAEEGGRVVEWLVPRGASVRAGQVIARLDDALMKSGYLAADAQYKIAQTNFEKQQKVYEENGISELQAKTSEFQRDAAKAQADLSKARLEKMSIKSPINGIVDARLVHAGEMIGLGMPIAHIVNLGRLKVEAGIPERYASSFKVGDHVAFSIDALPGEKFRGNIVFVGSAVNRDNRAIPVEVSVTQKAGRLKPDMIAAMDVTLDAVPNAIVIHEDYVQNVDLNKFVVFVAEGNTAHERVITISANNDGKILVKSGLKAGEKLITLGFQNVTDGQTISIQN